MYVCIKIFKNFYVYIYQYIICYINKNIYFLNLFVKNMTKDFVNLGKTLKFDLKIRNKC